MDKESRDNGVSYGKGERLSFLLLPLTTSQEGIEVHDLTEAENHSLCASRLSRKGWGKTEFALNLKQSLSN